MSSTRDFRADAKVLHLRMQEVLALASVVRWLADTTLQQGFTDALTIYCL